MIKSIGESVLMYIIYFVRHPKNKLGQWIRIGIDR